MCVSPIRIRNPNYHNKSGLISALADTSSMYINVPCGHCSECVAVRQMGIIQRVQMEELTNHIFFCTLTYSNDAMPVISTSTGYDIRYADFSDVQKMLKRLRKHNAFGRSFRYFCVSELSKRGRPHFHLLFFVPKLDSDDYNDCLNLENVMFHAVLSEWRRNKGSVRKPIWQPCCQYVRKMIRGRIKSNFDLHYVDPRTTDNGTADVGFYVTKYMIKPSDRAERLQSALRLNLDPDEYNQIWSIVKPKWVASLKFGLSSNKAKNYVYDCVSRSLDTSDSPKFYNPVTGSTFPLSRYYLNKDYLFNVGDALIFNDKKQIKDNVVMDNRHISEKLRSVENYKKRLSMIDSNDESYLFDELDG